MKPVQEIEYSFNEKNCLEAVAYYSSIETKKLKKESSGDIYKCYRHDIKDSMFPLFINHARFDGVSLATVLSIIHLPEFQKELNPELSEFQVVQKTSGISDIVYVKMNVNLPKNLFPQLIG